MKKVIAIIVVILILVGAAVGGIMYFKHKNAQELEALQVLYEGAQSQIETLELQNENLQNPPHVAVTVKTLKEYVAPASELVTYKYFYTDTGTYEKNKTFGDSNIAVPFTKDKSVYVYSGVISAGIDVSDIKFVVDESNLKIMVVMPQSGVIAHELDTDSFQAYDVQNSIFMSSNLNDFAQFEGALKNTQEDKLNSNDAFWKEVRNNSENVIKSLITANGEIDDYELEFSWVGE